MRWLLLIVLCLPAQAFGATYFVDFVAGSDANAGTSSSVPWKRPPGMVNEATGVTLAEGDLVCLKGGVTWVDPLVPQPGVTYASIGGGALNVLAACLGWGAGKAIIDVPLVTAATGAVLLDGTSDRVTIDGLKVTNRDNVNVDTRCAIYIEGTAGNHVIDPHIQFSEATASESGICVAGYTDGFLIWNNTAHDNDTSKANCTSSGVNITGKTATDIHDGVIRHNDLYNNGPSCFSIPDVNSEGRGLTFQTGGTAILVEDNTIYNNGAYPDGVGIDAGGVTEVTLRGNEVSGFEAAEIKAGSNNWTISGNLFTNTDNLGTFNYGYYLADSIGTTITHNTFVATTAVSGWVIGFTSPGTTTTFANNVIVCPAGHTGPAIVFSQVTGWAQSSWDGRVYGNAIQGCGTFSDEVTSLGVHTVRTLLEHQLAYPLQGLATLFHPDLGIMTSNPYRTRGTSPVRNAVLSAPAPCLDVRLRPCALPADIGAYQSTSGDPAATRSARN